MINFKDTSLIIQYLQIFLKENFNKDLVLTDEYDEETHENLINYLKLPETLDYNHIKLILINKFTFREKSPPYKLINDGGIWNFNYDISDNYIRFYNRPINICFNGALKFLTDYMDEVDELCKQYGWRLKSYTNIKNISNLSSSDVTLEFSIVKENRNNYFPNKEVLKMINLNNNKKLLGKCFIDENNSFHGYIQNSKLYKIYYIPAKSGESFTLYHGYDYACEMAIGYTDVDISNVNLDMIYVKNIISRLSSSITGEVEADEYVTYNIPENEECKYLLIQMPYENVLLNSNSKYEIIKVGDVNNDGRIDNNEYDENSDVSIIERHVSGVGKLTGNKLIAANINRDHDDNGENIVNDKDVSILKYSDPPLDFGEIKIEKTLNLTSKHENELLIIYGDIDLEYYNNEINIPFKTFKTNPWMIHDEFITYLLGHCVHKYSNKNDISYIQNLISKLNINYKPIVDGLYDEYSDYDTNDRFIWNSNKQLFEFFKNSTYTGMVANNKTDLRNCELLNESDMSKTGIRIINGKWIVNNDMNTEITVNSSGVVEKNNAMNSLKRIIQNIQKKYNKNEFNTEKINFCFGNVNPITERILKEMINE